MLALLSAILFVGLFLSTSALLAVMLVANKDKIAMALHGHRPVSTRIALAVRPGVRSLRQARVPARRLAPRAAA